MPTSPIDLGLFAQSGATSGRREAAGAVAKKLGLTANEVYRRSSGQSYRSKTRCRSVERLGRWLDSCRYMVRWHLASDVSA